MEEAINNGDLDTAQQIAYHTYFRDLYDYELIMIIDRSIKMGDMYNAVRAFNMLELH